MSRVTCVFAVCLSIIGSSSAPASLVLSDFTFVGTRDNATNPSVWLTFDIDVTAHVLGASNALLTFDLRNDVFGPNLTRTGVYFRDEGSIKRVHFEYVTGLDTNHWRNVILNVDGIVYRDQYGAFNNHLGSEAGGTAAQGAGVASNIFGETGFAAATYVLSVPEPSGFCLFAIGVGAISQGRRRRRMT